MSRYKLTLRTKSTTATKFLKILKNVKMSEMNFFKMFFLIVKTKMIKNISKLFL